MYNYVANGTVCFGERKVNRMLSSIKLDLWPNGFPYKFLKFANRVLGRPNICCIFLGSHNVPEIWNYCQFHWNPFWNLPNIENQEISLYACYITTWTNVYIILRGIRNENLMNLIWLKIETKIHQNTKIREVFLYEIVFERRPI